MFSISTTLGQECPTALKQLSGSLETSQENSKTIKVDWSQILTSSNLEESCIEEVKIVVKQENEAQTEEEVKIEAGHFGLVTVTPCQKANVKLKLKIKEASDYIESASSETITFQQPDFDGSALSDKGPEYVSFAPNDEGKIDLTRIRIKGSLRDIVEDMDCKKVVAVNVTVTKEGEEVPISHKIIWNNANDSTELLDDTLDGLDDFCKGHNIIIELIGTEGKSLEQLISITQHHF